MPLRPGDALAHYRIVSALGSGGMGEVYRASDPKLGRDVAIKVLPDLFAEDPRALARFEAEARAVAALSHPNILSIFDFGKVGETAFAVMELLEGRTLREQLEAEGALPLRKALEVGAQIARGLAAAHERGIVHRDLKPGNLFLTRDGRVKILDFGLAKQHEPLDSESAIAAAPTMGPGTEPGMVLGTVGYMAPEQVRGEPADTRSDIFALGAVLYEIVTGERAFAHATSAETMTAILREEPSRLGDPTARIPAALERVLRHCLEKNPRERFRSAGDLAFALENLVAGSGSESAVTAVPRVGERGRWALLGAGALAAAAMVFAAGWLVSPTRPEGTGSPLPRSFQQLTETPGVESAPSLSPDGKNVVFVSDAAGNRDLYLLRVGGRNPVPLTADSPDDDLQPAFSPDGESIAFRSDRAGGGIFVMGTTGESVRRLTDFGFDPSWSPDGREIVIASGTSTYPTDVETSVSDLWAIDAESGSRRRLSRGINAQKPSWSPHGHRIAYWTLRGAGGQRDLFTLAADGSEIEGGGLGVTDDAALDWSPTWSPDGRFLYFSSTLGGTMNLWRVPIDERTGRATGDPEPVTVPSVWSGNISFARDGRLFAFASLDFKSRLLRAPFDARRGELVGPPEPVLESNRPIRDHQISPDGAWVVFSLRGQNEDLAVARLDGSRYLRLTDDAYRDRGPNWSADGSRIAFYSDRSGGYQAWTIRPDGSGLVQVSESEGGTNFPVWSRSDDRIAYSVSSGEGGWYLVDGAAVSVRAHPQRMPDYGSDRAFWPMAWSRDGGLIAGLVVRPEGTFDGLATFSLANGTFRLLAPDRTSRWDWCAWLQDSRRLIVREERGISLLDTATGSSKLLHPVGGYWIGESVGVTRDDRWITWTETATEGDVWLAEMGETGTARR